MDKQAETKKCVNLELRCNKVWGEITIIHNNSLIVDSSAKIEPLINNYKMEFEKKNACDCTFIINKVIHKL